MERVLMRLDRFAGTLFYYVALVPLLFALVFFATLVFLGSGRALAADDLPTCSGKNLLEELKISDPERYALFEQDAAKIINGNALLWKIDGKNGVAPSWLYGTFHLTDPRVINLSEPAQKAFDDAKTVVIEVAEIVDPKKTAIAIFSNPHLTSFAPGKTIADFVSDEQVIELKENLGKRNIPFVTVQAMRPWLIASMVSLPACELKRKQAQLPFLDMKLAQDAEKNGKTLAGLETMTSQLELMNSLPIDLHVKGLIATLKMGDELNDIFETMVALYTQGEINKIWPMFHAFGGGGIDDEDDYVEFERVMITKRNHTMVENGEPFVNEGAAFIAVGALHLPGEEGLVELFRKQGYKVTPVH